MQEITVIHYKGYFIHVNYWNEYCVCYDRSITDIVSHNACFKRIRAAKDFIIALAGIHNPRAVDIEQLADNIKHQYAEKNH